MEQKGTIRRSRRLRDRGLREKKEGRKSVGDDLGVTPVRGKAVNLAEARAMQDAREWGSETISSQAPKPVRAFWIPPKPLAILAHLGLITLAIF